MWLLTMRVQKVVDEVAETVCVVPTSHRVMASCSFICLSFAVREAPMYTC
jgi:hypothetical protein